MSDKPEIKFYSWLNGIRSKCAQLRMPTPTALEQKYLAKCWKNLHTVAEGIEALVDWRRS